MLQTQYCTALPDTTAPPNRGRTQVLRRSLKLPCRRDDTHRYSSNLSEIVRSVISWSAVSNAPTALSPSDGQLAPATKQRPRHVPIEFSPSVIQNVLEDARNSPSATMEEKTSRGANLFAPFGDVPGVQDTRRDFSSRSGHVPIAIPTFLDLYWPVWAPSAASGTRRSAPEPIVSNNLPPSLLRNLRLHNARSSSAGPTEIGKTGPSAASSNVPEGITRVRSRQGSPLRHFIDDPSSMASKRRSDMSYGSDSSKMGPTGSFDRYYGRRLEMDSTSSRHTRSWLVSDSDAITLQIPGGVTSWKPDKRLSQDMPTYLQLDHEDEVSLVEGRSPRELRGGTLRALIEQLTRHDYRDADFIEAFLLTFPLFTTHRKLFEMLIQRFNVQPPTNMTEDQNLGWANHKQRPIRLRVINVLRTLLDRHWTEGTSAEIDELRQDLFAFTSESLASGDTESSALATILDALGTSGRGNRGKRLVLNLSGPFPLPIIPEDIRDFGALDVAPREFARQLTIFESRLYCKIKSLEWLNKMEQIDGPLDKDDPAPNIKAMIRFSNRLTSWVCGMVLAQSDPKRQKRVFNYFVNVADQCRKLNNFSTLQSIMLAFPRCSCRCSSRPWDRGNLKAIETLHRIEALMDFSNNRASYRKALQHADPPCVPFIGIYLSDLTFIKDGNLSVFRDTGHVNFTKYAMIAKVIREVILYQNKPYSLQPLPELQAYIQRNLAGGQ